jgi:hypothetical protein
VGTAPPFARSRAMIAISITLAAYNAISPTVPRADDVPPRGADGLIRIWLDRRFVERLRRIRGPDESYSDVILRLADMSP